jgi:O-antigen/teichoic acid export membrane protein
MFIRSAFESLLAKSIAMALSFMSGVLIARNLGPESRGEYGLIITVSTILVVVANFGLPESGIIKYSTQPDVYAQKSLIDLSLSIIILLLGLFILIIKQYVVPSNILSMNIVLASGLLSAVEVFMSHLRHYCLGNQKYSDYNFIQIWVPVLGFCFLNIYVFIGDLSLNTAVSANILSVIFVGIYCISRQWIYQIKKPTFELNIKYNYNRLKGAFQFLQVGLLSVVSQKVLYFFIAYKVGKYGLGIYAVSEVVPNLFLNVCSQLSTLIFSTVAKNKSSATKFTRKAVQLQILFGTIFLLVTLVLGKQILTLVYTTRFSEALIPMQYLCVAAVFSGVSSTLLNYLSAIGLVSIVLKLNIISFLLMVVLCTVTLFFSDSGVRDFSIINALTQFLVMIYVMIQFKGHTGCKIRSLFIFNDFFGAVLR